jgi:hypothetical protein
LAITDGRYLQLPLLDERGRLNGAAQVGLSRNVTIEVPSLIGRAGGSATRSSLASALADHADLQPEAAQAAPPKRDIDRGIVLHGCPSVLMLGDDLRTMPHKADAAGLGLSDEDLQLEEAEERRRRDEELKAKRTIKFGGISVDGASQAASKRWRVP